MLPDGDDTVLHRQHQLYPSSKQLSQKMKGLYVILTVISAFFAVAISDAKEDVEDLSLDTTTRMVVCGAQCNFRLCKANVDQELAPIGRRILLRDPRVALPPFLCRKDLTLVKVRRVGQAKVAPNGKGPKKFTPISKYRPFGLTNPFPRKYFGLFDINFPPLPGKVGVGRLGNVGNQDDFADDLCVLLPIKRFDVMERFNVRTVKGKRDDCVAFRTWSPKLLIELTWASSDDFDLFVTEPNNNIISRLKTNSGTGGRLINDNVGACDVNDLTGKEQVRWLKRDNPLMGKYTVTIRHFTKCSSNIETKWNIAVIAKGKFLTGKSGTSNMGGNSVVTTLTFNL